MIIGITGTLGAGKGTIVEYLKTKGFKHYSATGFLTEEIIKRGMVVNRDAMVSIANELRAKFGPSYLAEQLYDRAKRDGSPAVIESLRTPGEINSLRKNSNFYLLAVDADIRTRYDRITKRHSEKDSIDFETFVNNEKREFTSDDPNKQNLSKCIELADYKIDNNGTIAELNAKVQKILDEIDKKIPKRMSKQEYYMNITKAVAQRSSCMSVRIGAIIVKDDQIISTGYVGAPRKTKDCMERENCLRRQLKIPSGSNYELCRSVHAEQNAIINAARAGTSVLGATMYLYGERILGLDEPQLIDAIPCMICKKMIINSGIKELTGMMNDGSMRTFQINDWAQEWADKDIIDDVVKYSTNYSK